MSENNDGIRFVPPNEHSPGYLRNRQMVTQIYDELLEYNDFFDAATKEAIRLEIKMAKVKRDREDILKELEEMKSDTPKYVELSKKRDALLKKQLEIAKTLSNVRGRDVLSENIEMAKNEMDYLPTLYTFLPKFCKSDDDALKRDAIRFAPEGNRIEMLWAIVSCSGDCDDEEPENNTKYRFFPPSIDDESYYIRRTKFNHILAALQKLDVNVANILDEYRRYVRHKNGTKPNPDENKAIDDYLLNLSSDQFFECVRMTIGIGREGTEETNPFVIVRKNTKKN
jgi:hypothetical protein